jgi:oxygen-independent coproporphyrinogen-3 oxidase
LSESPAGLYLHIPFCARVCPYCDFAVRTGDRERRRRFADHLVAEIELYAAHQRAFDTIYFGGGTPSHLEVDELGRIVEAVRRRMRLEADTRIFLEANPEDATEANVAGWRALGVDTLSLGLQSMRREGLEFLGRRHGVEAGREAVRLAREAGFRTVSIDLIYGRPGQTAEGWRAELALALELGADHISCYQLTIHQRTRFALLEKRGQLTQLAGDAQGELFELTHRLLNDAGMQGYEVSQFAASPQHRSRHNMKYWDHTPYLGLGPSAHSFDADERWWNLRRSDPWQDAIAAGRRPVEERESLDERALALEALMTGLRTYAGVELRGRLRDGNAALIERMEAQGLLKLEGDRLLPTLAGLAVADSLAASFDLG